MDQLTAKKLFNSLYRALDKNGFKEEVATFLIGWESNEIYPDSSLALTELYSIAQQPGRSKRALRLLTNAVKRYFSKASDLVDSYQRELSKLTAFGSPVLQIPLLLSDSFTKQPVDVRSSLNPPELKPFLEMVDLIRLNLESDNDGDNDSFLGDLKNV